MNDTMNSVCKAIGETLKENEKPASNDTTAEKIVGIYGLRNKITGKWYVGQSIDIEHRWGVYSKGKCKSQSKLHRALGKYGIDAFEKHLIELCDPVQWILDYREVYWIQYLNSIKHGYNIREGGQGGKHSDDTKRKMSIAAKNRKPRTFSAEGRENIRKSVLGRKHSEETKEKIRLAHMGMKPSQETREKLRNALLGRKLSEERIAKMKLVVVSQETRAKLSAVRRGRKRPPEVVAKIQATKKANRLKALLNIPS